MGSLVLNGILLIAIPLSVALKNRISEGFSNENEDLVASTVCISCSRLGANVKENETLFDFVKTNGHKKLCC